MALPPLARTASRWALLTTAILCVVFSGLSILATLAAGGLQMDGDYPDGAGYLLMSSIAVVRFNGIIPSETDSTTYQVKLLWFLNTFGWEWPTTWEKSCGIVNNINGLIPDKQLTLPEDLGLAANRLRLPREDYACLDKWTSRSGFCHNSFLAAWDFAEPGTTIFSTAIAHFIFYFCGCLLLSTAVQEIGLRWIPSLVKCRCPGFLRERGWCCSLGDGTSITPEKRNRVRIMALLTTAIFYAISALILGLQGARLVAYLKRVDAKVGGMDPQMGAGFVGQSIGTLCAILLSVLCLKVRGLIRKDQSWMKEQLDGEGVVLDIDETDETPAEAVDGDDLVAPLPVTK